MADLVRAAPGAVEWRYCDVRDVESVRAACRGADLIYNLAAEHRDDVRPLQRYHDVNVSGAETVCQAAEELDIENIVFTSSVAIYGLPKEELDENAVPAPFNEYGRTKLAAEAVYRRWQARDPKRTLVTVRPTVTFGPGNKGNVYNLLRQIASGRFIMVGQGTNRKSMAYVENVAAFLEFVSAFPPGTHTFNYADKPDLDINSLVRLVFKSLGKNPRSNLRLPYYLGYSAGAVLDCVASLTGQRFPLSRVRVQKFCANTMFSAEKALQEGFVPPFTLAQGLQRTLEADFSASASSDGTRTDVSTDAPRPVTHTVEGDE